MRQVQGFLSAATVGACILTAGCAGGGGGGGPSITDVTFTSFSAVGRNERVHMKGMAQTATGTQSTVGTTTTVTSTTINAPNPPGSSALTLTYDSFGALSGIGITTPQSNISFNRSNGDSINCAAGSCGAFNPTAEAAIVDPTLLGWNYQTYGIWDRNLSATTFEAGAISAGNPTPASAVPTSGGATFTGAASGYFINAGGNPFITSANMSAAVADFSTGAITFQTTGTIKTDVNTAAQTPDANLDMSGTLSITPGTNRFSGSVGTSAALGLNGTASGQFYGPAAQEIGGTYNLTGLGGKMLGGFGGKR